MYKLSLINKLKLIITKLSCEHEVRAKFLYTKEDLTEYIIYVCLNCTKIMTHNLYDGYFTKDLQGTIK